MLIRLRSRYFLIVMLIMTSLLTPLAQGHELPQSPFLTPNAPLLSQPVDLVPSSELTARETKNAIKQMLEVAAGERIPGKMRMLGLAAPQIGINKAIILVDTSVTERGTDWAHALDIFINPQIISSSSEQIEGKEGCYSVDPHVAGIVPRAQSITVTAYDAQGNPFTKTYSGFTARILQHEIDHLNGIRFPDRVGKNGVLHWVEPEQYADYRTQWQQWPHRFHWDTWQEMKGVQSTPAQTPAH